MPFNPSERNKGSDYLFAGISSFGQSVGDGIAQYKQNKKRYQLAEANFESTFQRYAQNNGEEAAFELLGEKVGNKISSGKANEADFLAAVHSFSAQEQTDLDQSRRDLLDQQSKGFVLRNAEMERQTDQSQRADTFLDEILSMRKPTIASESVPTGKFNVVDTDRGSEMVPEFVDRNVVLKEGITREEALQYSGHQKLGAAGLAAVDSVFPRQPTVGYVPHPDGTLQPIFDGKPMGSPISVGDTNEFEAMSETQQKEVGTLRNEFLKQPAVATWVKSEGYRNSVEDLVAKIDAGTYKAPDDVALVFQFMKSLDPNSVVRESEYRVAATAAGVDNRVINSIERVLEGDVLDDETRRLFLAAANTVTASYKDSASGFVDFYSGQAKDRGIDPKFIVPNFFEEEEGKKAEPQSAQTFEGTTYKFK